MADALGVLASSLQLASTIKEIWEIYEAYRDATNEITKLKDSLKDLEQLLLHINRAFPNSSVAYPPTLKSALQAIRSDVDLLLKTTSLGDNHKPSRDRMRDRLRWVLKDKKGTVELTQSVERHKSSLMIVLQVLSKENNFKQFQNIQGFILHTVASQTLDLKTFVAGLEQIKQKQDRNLTRSDKSGSSFINNPPLGYLPKDIDHVIYRGSAGSIDLAVTQFHQPGSTTTAFNTSLRLKPLQRENEPGNAIVLEYLQVQNQKKLPSPYQRLRVVTVIPTTSRIFEEVLGGNLAEVRFLIENRMASVYDEDPVGLTLLHKAVAPGYTDITEYLLSQGADPEARDSNFRTPLDVLHEYSPRGLCKSSATYGGHFTPSTLLKGYIGCCQALHRNGSSTSADSFDLLSSAISTYICSDGIDLDSDDEFDAVYQWGEYLRSIQVDIDGFYGADFNALMAVAKDDTQDFFNLMALILACGARSDIRDANGMQVLHHILDPMYGQKIHYLVEKKIVLLIQHSNKRAAINRSRSHSMVWDYTVLEQLLESRDRCGMTPRDYAQKNWLLQEYNRALRHCGIPNNILEMENAPLEWHAWFTEEPIHEESQSNGLVYSSISRVDSVLWKGKLKAEPDDEIIWNLPRRNRILAQNWDHNVQAIVVENVPEILQHPAWRLFLSLVLRGFLDQAYSRLQKGWGICYFMITWAGACIFYLLRPLLISLYKETLYHVVLAGTVCYFYCFG